MQYPKYAKINGKKYKINTDYRIALECFEIINNPNISDTERTYAIVYKLFGFIPNDNEINQFVEKAELFLGNGQSQEEQQSRDKDMDFKHDWKYIVASFMSDYHIDINQTDIHWYQFIDLIQGLTENTALSRVREIRNYDLSEVKDQKLRRQIIKAQQQVALPVELSEEEENAIDEFESLLRR